MKIFAMHEMKLTREIKLLTITMFFTICEMVMFYALYARYMKPSDGRNVLGIGIGFFVI